MPLSDPQLGLFEARPDDPNVKWLEHLLLGAGCWMTARDIMLTAGNGRLKDRDVRSLASASDCIISGQRGYKHADAASAGELDHAANWLVSQADRMKQRAIRLRNYGHRRIG